MCILSNKNIELNLLEYINDHHFFFEKFENMIEAIKGYGRCTGNHMSMMHIKLI